jgi:nucleoside-diphosphate-sugar epimerase
MPGWDVVGVSRRVAHGLDGPSVSLLSVDLLDAAACEAAFGGMGDVTHFVYAALQENPGLFAGWLDAELMERNAAMLRNLFEPLSRAATGLRHVSLLHGTKAYGIHHPSLGPAAMKIPLREREPRREHPNFYFLQEDYLREKQRGHSWGLTVFRPTVVYGDAPGNNMNSIPVIAAYAAILRERGEPLHFPGRPGAPAIREAVDADLIASALAWAADSPAAAGGTYNLTNGDVFTWENVWPAVADAVGMEPGEARHISLAQEMPEWADEWRAIVRKYELNAPEDLLEFVGANSLTYTDMVLSSPAQTTLPILNSTIAARQAGFPDCIDTEDMFRALFARMQAQGVIPPRAR